MKTNNRGAIPVIVWAVLAGVAALGVAVPNFRPWNWGGDKVAAANKELITAQADLEKAKAEAKKAQDALAATEAAELAKKDAQTRYAQEMTAGASKALESAPASAPVALAKSLLARANPALAAAIGMLPQEQQDEIYKIVDQTLSGSQKDLAEANAKLAQLDKQLAVTTSERDALKQQLPVLQAKVDSTEAVIVAKTSEVAQKTQGLVTAAEKIAAKNKEAGSLTAQVNNLGRLLLVIGIIYLFAHLILPSLAQEFPGFGLLGTLNKTVKSITSAHQ